MSQGYWIKFLDGSSGYCEGDDQEDAVMRAVQITGKLPKESNLLPYPAFPVIWQSNNCPTFCWTPDRCRGRSSCPKERACCD